MPLAATMQPPDCLFKQFERPGQGHEHEAASAVLEVEPVAGGLWMDQEKFDFAGVPPLDGAVVVEGNRVLVSTLELSQLFFVVVSNDRIGMLVFLQ